MPIGGGSLYAGAKHYQEKLANKMDEQKEKQNSFDYAVKQFDQFEQENAMTNEKREYYGRIIKMEVDAEVEGFEFERIKRDADSKKEKKLIGKSEEEIRQIQRKEIKEKYNKYRDKYGEVVTMKTAYWRMQIKQYKRERKAKLQEEPSPLNSFSEVVKGVDFSELTSDLFDPRTADMKKLFRIRDTFDDLKRLYPADAMDGLTKTEKDKVSRFLALEEPFKKALAEILRDHSINEKGRVDPMMARENQLDNQRMNQYLNNHRMITLSDEAQDAVNNFLEVKKKGQDSLLERAQKGLSEKNKNWLEELQQRQSKDVQVSEAQKKKDEEEYDRLSDLIKKVKQDAIDTNDSDDFVIFDTKDDELKQKSLKNILTDYKAVMDDVRKTEAKLEELSSRINETLYRTSNIDGDIICDRTISEDQDRLQAIYESEKNSDDLLAARKRAYELKRMITAVCKGVPLTESMRKELEEKYKIAYKNEVTEEEEQEREEYKGKITEKLEKQTERLESILGERSLSEMTWKERWVFGEAAKFMRSSSYVEWKKKKKTAIKYMSEHIGEYKNSLSLDSDKGQETKKSGQKFKSLAKSGLKFGANVAFGYNTFEKIYNQEINGMTVEDFLQNYSEAMTAVHTGGNNVLSIVLLFSSWFGAIKDELSTGIGNAASFAGNILSIAQSVATLNADSMYEASSRKVRKELTEKLNKLLLREDDSIEGDSIKVKPLERMVNMMKANANKLSLDKDEHLVDFGVNIGKFIFGLTKFTGAFALNSILNTVWPIVVGLISSIILGKKRKNYRKEFVNGRFQRVMKELKRDSKEFRGLSERDQKHLLLRFVGVRTGKRSEASIMAMKKDAEYVLDNSTSEMAEEKKSVLEGMHLKQDSKTSDVMIRMGADESHAIDPVSNVKKMRQCTGQKFAGIGWFEYIKAIF